MIRKGKTAGKCLIGAAGTSLLLVVLLFPMFVTLLGTYTGGGPSGRELGIFYRKMPDCIAVWTGRHALSGRYSDRSERLTLRALRGVDSSILRDLDEELLRAFRSPDYATKVSALGVFMESGYIPPRAVAEVGEILLCDQQDYTLRSLAGLALLFSGELSSIADEDRACEALIELRILAPDRPEPVADDH